MRVSRDCFIHLRCYGAADIRTIQQVGADQCVCPNKKMIPFNKALNIILNQCQTLGTERKKLEDLAGYATAKPVISKFNSPLFDNSAVDGYGVLIQDLKNIPCKLKLTGAIFAGHNKNSYRSKNPIWC